MLHRYFFCLRPPEMLTRQMGALRDAQEPQEAVGNERLHMALAITPDFAEHRPEAAEQMKIIAETVSAEPIALCFDTIWVSGQSIALRPRRRPAALALLQNQLWRRLDYRGLAREGWSFNPHVTLGYRTGAPAEPIGIEPLEWTAREFLLIHSLVVERRHIELGRWWLGDRQLGLPV